MKANLIELPFLNVIESVSYETYKQRLLDLFHQYADDSTLSEASDEIVLLEAFAYQLLFRDSAINSRISQILPTLADGANLDLSCQNFYGTERLLGESDADFLKRSLYSLQQSNTAGSSWSYLYHTLGVDEHIADVHAFRSSPGVVTIVFYAIYTDEYLKLLLKINSDILGAEEIREIEQKRAELINDLKEKIENRLNDDKLRPLNELQIVKPALRKEYNIKAVLKIKAGVDGAVASNEAKNRVEKYAKELKIGNEVKQSKLIALLHTEGVGEVVMIEPLSNLVITNEEVAICKDIEITTEIEQDE
jgi:phage-related baseplate assembly protein